MGALAMINGRKMNEVSMKDSNSKGNVQGQEANNQQLTKELVRERKRSEILITLAKNVLYEYDEKNDQIIFSREIKFDTMHCTKITQCSKPSTLVRLIHPEDREAVTKFLHSKEDAKVQFRYLSKGGYHWFQSELRIMYDGDSKEPIRLGNINNINKEKQEQDEMERKMQLDPLTRIYNRKALERRITEYLKEEGSSQNHAFMIVDINNFKAINKKLGYLFGDTILVNVAETLNEIFYHSDFVGRIGGDEFLVFLKNVSDRNLLISKAEQICKVFADTYTGEDNDYCMSCSIGISLYPQDGKNFTQLFKNADTASYIAQKKGYGKLMFYENCGLHLKKEDEKEQFYNHYDVRDGYRYGKSNFDKEITMFAVDIMSRTKDVNSAITLLLNRVVKLLDVDYVRIYETTYDNNSLRMDYSSGKKDKIRVNNVIVYREEHLKEYVGLFENGVFSASSTTKIPSLCVKQYMYERGIQSILQCAIFEDDKFQGCVSIEDMQKERNWTEYEISSLATITMIVSSYLLKLRTNEQAKIKLDHLVNYDQLTGLPSLDNFKQLVKEIMQEDFGDSYAIVNSDISNFKYINDTFGFEIGNSVLCEYASMLQREEVCLAVTRVSADNFMFLMKFADAECMIKRVMTLNEMFSLSQRKRLVGLKLNVITGVCMLHHVGEIVDAIDKANLARKSKKSEKKSVCKIYDNGMQEQIRKEIEIMRDMESALMNNEFVVYLQPKIGLKENALVGAEALIRWIRPDGTMMYPDEFIPLFEKNGFIINLDFYVYENVCKLLDRWRKQKNLAIPISVNMSRLHLNDDEFVGKFKKVVEQYRIPSDYLELELTESMVLNNVDSAIQTMQSLKALGFRVSIDDFGAGYSSLNLLKDLKSDVLKLDKEFFRQGYMKKEDKIIVSSIISMAKQLNMQVLSEGVETKMQSDFLREISCDMAQGYLYAKPMPIYEFEQLMLKYAKRPY